MEGTFGRFIVNVKIYNIKLKHLIVNKKLMSPKISVSKIN